MIGAPGRTLLVSGLRRASGEAWSVRASHSESARWTTKIRVTSSPDGGVHGSAPGMPSLTLSWFTTTTAPLQPVRVELRHAFYRTAVVARPVPNGAHGTGAGNRRDRSQRRTEYRPGFWPDLRKNLLTTVRAPLRENSRWSWTNRNYRNRGKTVASRCSTARCAVRV